MTDLIDTTEMYLKTVFELQELGVRPMRARIAERLSQSGPTVSQTVARMERDGLLHLDAERVIHLSEEGEKIATDVMRKHRLAERHLTDIVGLEYALVHEEACRWEHVMSLEVERKIAALIEPPYVDPYGNPIPGLAELGIKDSGTPRCVPGATVDGKDSASGVRRLIDIEVPDSGIDVDLVAIGEVIQSDVEFLRDLAGQGIVAGVRLHVSMDADSLLLEHESGGAITISPLDASHLGVWPVEAP